MTGSNEAMEIGDNTTPRLPEGSLEELRAQLQMTRKENEEMKKILSSLQDQFASVFLSYTRSQNNEIALANVIKEREKYEPKPSSSLTGKKRKRGQPLDPQLRAIIGEQLQKQNKSWKELCDDYSVSESTVARISRELREEEENEKNEKLGRPTKPCKKKQKRGPCFKIDSASMLFLFEMLEENNGLTLKQLVNLLREKRGLEVSKSTVARALSDASINWKETVEIPINWNEPSILEARMKYVCLILPRYISREKIYLDECSWNLKLSRKKGRALEGTKATVSVLPKGPNLTMLVLISRSKVIYYKFVISNNKKRGVNADDFRLFLIDIGPKRSKESLLILDNAKIHHANSVEENYRALQSMYGIETEFLPPYSPFLNPVELLFSKIKNHVRRESFANIDELRAKIEEAIEMVTAEDLEGFYRHVDRYQGYAATGLPFIGRPLSPTLDSLTAYSPSSTSSTPSLPLLKHQENSPA